MKIALGIIGGLLFLATAALAGDPSPGEVVQAWTRLYGQDTARAAGLTTDRFRRGEAPGKWARRTQRALQDIGYRHLGGEIIEEKITGEVTTVILKACIVAVDGVSVQKEVYTIKRVEGRWLIDTLEVKDEIVPGGKLRYGI